MTNPLVSIVVPIYNASKYIDELCDCLLNQTYKNIEIVLVDDFSSDNSYEILRKKIENECRVKLIKRNEKGGTAIKGTEYGLKYCTGDYFFYLSQDDIIDYDMIEKCLKVASDNNLEIVIPNMVLYYGDKAAPRSGVYPLNNNYNSFVSGKEAFILSLNWKIHTFMLVSMNLVNKVGLRADYYNSEEYYSRKRFLYVEKLGFADTNFYYRQDNPEAITKKLNYFQIDILITNIMLFELMIEDDRFKEDEIKEYLKELIIDSFDKYGSLLGKFTRIQNNYVKKQYESAYKKLLKYCKIFDKSLLKKVRLIKSYRSIGGIYHLIER